MKTIILTLCFLLFPLMVSADLYNYADTKPYREIGGNRPIPPVFGYFNKQRKVLIIYKRVIEKEGWQLIVEE